ncbi:hypothetical protein CRUP_031399 [Coryphaenoides rupestris]|nr:hypothetical protein CRUP_031399 [Coryphaenoides rupestris]
MSSVMSVERFYSSAAVRGRALQRAAQLNPQLSITTEMCYNVELTGGEALSSPDRAVLTWLFQSPMQTEPLSPEPFLVPQAGQRLVEIGPRLNFSTSWSTNAVSICQSAGVGRVTRVELSRRLLIKVGDKLQPPSSTHHSSKLHTPLLQAPPCTPPSSTLHSSKLPPAPLQASPSTPPSSTLHSSKLHPPLQASHLHSSKLHPSMLHPSNYHTSTSTL